MSGVQIFGYYLAPIAVERLFGLAYTILSTILLFLLGRILHESTHWLVAWLVGADVKHVKIGLFSGGRVEYELAREAARWRYWAIQASPQILGIAVGLPYLAWLMAEATSPLLWFFVAVFLTSYSVLGGAGDLIPLAARGDGHLWHPTKRDQLYVIALGITIMGALLGMLPADGGVIEHWGAWTGRWMMSGGIAIVGWDLWRSNQMNEA